MRHEDARLILPNAIYLPPAAMGDVLGAARRFRPHSISIVDGTFLSNMSVFHKEILYAIDLGIWVLGSSSMGALRAAECDDYGMIGIGEIYQKLVSGEIEDDDEVALTHAGEAEGFKALTDAFVTIKATIEGAFASGLLNAHEAEVLIAMQKARYFPDRRLSSIPTDAREIGIDPERVEVLRNWARHHAIDPKRNDALALLQAVTELPDWQIPREDRPGVVLSLVFSATLARDVVVATPEGNEVTLDQMRKYAALHEDDFESVMREARLTRALLTLGGQIGGAPTEDELAKARVQVALRIGINVDELDDYFLSVDLDTRGIFALLAGEAMSLRLENSWLGRSRKGMINDQFMNALRLRNRYLEVKSAAAMQQTAAKSVAFEPRPSYLALIYTHAALTDWPFPDNWDEYIEHHEFVSLAEFSTGLLTSVKAHHAFFDTGVIQPDDDVAIIVSDDGPMMTRGR
jgi:hypothetical protein